MPVHDELGKRMKGYEQVSKTVLMKRTPVAIRIDGRAFHTFTKGLKKPFDFVLVKSMQQTMQYLCQNIQGCVFGYTQSDEITLILTDYATFETSAWFDYEVQKLCSISASMATMAFNKFFAENVAEEKMSYRTSLVPQSVEMQQKMEIYHERLDIAVNRGAMFDARCFNISKEEVCNLVYWRQLDAMRNSIQMVGQANFSHKELQGKTCENIKEMLKIDRKILWSDLPIHYQRGTACFYAEVEHTDGKHHIEWYIDENMPILKGEDRKYLERWI